MENKLMHTVLVNAINGDLEKLLIDGCRIIAKGSKNYDSNYTHILLQLPKGYRADEVKGEKREVNFISVEWMEGQKSCFWYEAIIYYSNMAHAKSSFTKRLREDRIDNLRIKELNKDK